MDNGVVKTKNDHMVSPCPGHSTARAFGVLVMPVGSKDICFQPPSFRHLRFLTLTRFARSLFFHHGGNHFFV